MSGRTVRWSWSWFCARVATIALLLWCGPPVAQAQGVAETWRTGYADRDANGAHVLGYWRFQPGAETQDSSAKAHPLRLDGAVAAAAGKFDGGLESFPGWPVEDKRHAAVADPQATLSPRGPFTIELWLKPKPALTADLSPVLLDKKYVAHADYQFRLTTADKSGWRRMQVILGFGDSSETFLSDPFPLADDWQHVAFSYDAAGLVRFFRNGAPAGSVTRPGRGPLAPGTHALSIGDRVGSYYAGFPGYLDEVRICDGALEFRPLAVEFHRERRNWLRMEQADPLRVVVRNLTKAELSGATLRLLLPHGQQREVAVPTLAAGAEYEVACEVDTTLRPDTYRVRAHLAVGGATPYASDEFAEFTVVPRPVPRMPVMMWGIGSPEEVRRELPRLKELGFTHCLGGSADYGAAWQAQQAVAADNPQRVADVKAMLDQALAEHFGLAFSLSPGGWLKERPELQRVDREGQPYASRPDVNAALPGLAEFCERVGGSVAHTYRSYPAWQAVLINTEVRDSSQVSFSEFDRRAYRDFSGAEIPAEVAIKNGVEWGKLPGFPANRVIPDDHPVLKFYRWFWTVGDGWNSLHSAVHRGVHSTGRDDVWTWFDPAIRTASVGGCGGEVDVLGQWTYTNPDPPRIGYFTDELFAMAANSAQRPRVMKMTQLFWYRSQTAPKKTGADAVPSPFDDHDPDAAYITISPIHLRESFWMKLARPVSGVMYHGWAALVPTDGTSAYRHTQPDTQNEFRRLHRDILEKLGPVLLQAPDRPSDVAFLDSFTAQMFARRGSYGYSNDEAYLTLLHAQLQPRVLHEDQLLPGLDGFRVLVLADCDVLTASVAARIRQFQQDGGLVIGDPNLAPAIKPDLLINKVARTKRGDADKAALLANAVQLRQALDGRYQRHCESSNPEIITRVRAAGGGELVFVVNDHREFGSYVGQHGLVMENGLPSAGDVRLRCERGSVYDLVAEHAVPAAVRDGALTWPVSLGPGEGRVFLVAPEPVAQVRIVAPAQAQPGEAATVHVAVANAAGTPIAALFPLHVEIFDSAGRLAEQSGYHAAPQGRLDLKLELAANDAAGVWQIHVRELASRQEVSAFLHVQRP